MSGAGEPPWSPGVRWPWDGDGRAVEPCAPQEHALRERHGPDGCLLGLQCVVCGMCYETALATDVPGQQ